MELEKQVCSLDLAKRLKELGVGVEKHSEYQSSLFYWVPYIRNDWRIEYADGRLSSPAFYSAFTVAELGLLIPKRISTDEGKSYWPCFGWIIDIDLTSQAFIWWEAEDENNSHEYFAQRADTEADARAKMLIYLLENKLVVL